jgi:hypothetical protein
MALKLLFLFCKSRGTSYGLDAHIQAHIAPSWWTNLSELFTYNREWSKQIKPKHKLKLKVA